MKIYFVKKYLFKRLFKKEVRKCFCENKFCSDFF